MTSGGSRRRECPLPQKVASLRPRASGLLGFAQKLRVLFGGPSLHSSVRLRRTRHSGQKSRRGRRPERCAAPVQPCLSLPGPPPPGGKGVSPFPDLSTRRRHLAGRGAGAKRPARSERSEIPERRYFRKSSITGTSVPCGSSTGSSSVSALSGVVLLRLE